MLILTSYGKIANNYIANVRDLGATLDSNVVAACRILNNFIFNKWGTENMKAFYIYWASNAAANRVDFMGAFPLTDYGTFLTNNKTGKKGDGVTAYSDTGFNPNTQGIDNIMIMAYNVDTNFVGGSYAMGANGPISTKNTIIQERNGTDNFRSGANSPTTILTSNTDSRGFFLNGRIDASNYLTNVNGVIQTHASALNRTDLNIFLHGRNNNTSPDTLSSRLYKGHCIGVYQSIHDELRTTCNYLFQTLAP